MALNIKMESKTYQYRKVTKPLLERKRRARINKCLDDLKDLMIECIKQQGDNILRLEKADILELTVDHLRKIKQNKSNEMKSSIINNNNTDSFKSGYIHAANEVSKALASIPRVDIDLGTKLMSHLAHRLNQIQQDDQPQQQRVILTKKNIEYQPVRGASPLSVYCGTDHRSTSMISPGLSSGYGSDSEFPASPLSTNQIVHVKDIWRPW